MVSLWQDIAPLRAFAGDDWKQAVIPDPERPSLTDVHVHHDEAFGSAGNVTPRR